jgi:hypothetical protein
LFVQSQAIHQLREALTCDAELLSGSRAMTAGPRQRGTNELRIERSPCFFKA